MEKQQKIENKKNIFLDSYFWYRGIGQNHKTAIISAKKENNL